MSKTMLYLVTSPRGHTTIIASNASGVVGAGGVKITPLCIDGLAEAIVAAAAVDRAAVAYGNSSNEQSDETWSAFVDALGGLSTRMGKLASHAEGGPKPAPLQMIDRPEDAEARLYTH